MSRPLTRAPVRSVRVHAPSAAITTLTVDPVRPPLRLNVTATGAVEAGGALLRAELIGIGLLLCAASPGIGFGEAQAASAMTIATAGRNLVMPVGRSDRSIRSLARVTSYVELSSRVHAMDEDHAYEQLATPEEKRQWAKQNNLMYGGLIAISVVILQGFLGSAALGVSGRISIVAFAVALPLLAVLILLGELHSEDPTQSTVTYEITKAVAMVGAATGVVAAFWHIDWLAGVAVLAAGASGLGVYGAHFSGSRFGQAALKRKAAGAPTDGATGAP